MIKFEKTIKDNYIMNFIGGIGNSICLCFFDFHHSHGAAASTLWGLGKAMAAIRSKKSGISPAMEFLPRQKWLVVTGTMEFYPLVMTNG